MKIGFVIDPLDKLKAYKDSTVAMIEAALKRGFEVSVMQMNDLFIEGPHACAMMQEVLSVDIKQSPWYQLGNSLTQGLSKLDVIFMRKDPPFNMDYIYCTYIG
jgi:glutathione synthase